jgi:tetratricopeptide (TPR) repeat protein
MMSERRVVWVFSALTALIAAAAPALQPTTAESDVIDRLRDAAALAQDRKLHEAIEAARVITRENPTNPTAWSFLGQLLMQGHRDAEAVGPLRKSVEIDPDQFATWQNLGQAYQNQDKHQECLGAFKQVLRLNPDNWRAHAKLVQCFQGLGNIEKRDAERQAIFKLNEQGKVDQPQYCREQFDVSGMRVLAFERFKLEGERARRYVFHVFGKDRNRAEFQVSLGSYTSTNQIEREAGRMREDQRLFHLDGYYPGGEHRTFAFYEDEPTYDQVREKVIEIVNGKAVQISSYKPTTQGAEIHLNGS